MTITERPNPETVLNGLKNFQRDTVEYVFRRLYTDPDATKRFLIADEVGLGKTLVARGLIAKTIDHLWERVGRVDIVYICSNADIARQNINKLNITGQSDFTFASRITLLPITSGALNANRINFVSFTPGTSFDMGNALGIVRERALLYWLLVDAWGLTPGRTAPINVFQGNAGAEGFRSYLNTFRREEYRAVDPSTIAVFAQALSANDARLQLRKRFDDLCERFGRLRSNVPWQDRHARARFVGDLRELLAETCLAALEPDLIILDEFQRFKHLLEHDQNSDVSQLAHQLFNYADHRSEARVVLLSATPYKMYTMTHDQEQGDDHYQDFLRTVRFLQPERADEFERLIAAYRREILRLGAGDASQVRAIKTELERCLRQVMVRTERLSADEGRNGMLQEIRGATAKLTPADLQSYIHGQRVARLLDQPDILEYWKSAPYLLNFMDDYQLKDQLQKALHQPDKAERLAAELARCQTMLLPWDDILAYQRIDPNNVRLRSLMTDALDSGAWRLLWVPPSLPYYQLEGPFAEPQLAQFTKRLVFSSWKLVPKVVATMLSYEAERQMMLSFDQEAVNTPEARERRRGLLMFTRADGRLSGMPVLGILYPSITLARDCDPLVATMDYRQHGVPQLGVIREQLRRVIGNRLAPLLRGRTTTGPEDQAWYWAAPILLDLHHYPHATRDWLRQPNLAQIWTGESEGLANEAEDRSGWSAHVEEARRLLQGGDRQLGRPPADLVDVLTTIALGGPGVAALRALWRSVEHGATPLPLAAKTYSLSIRNDAAQVAWAFRSLYNLPEAMALLRGMAFEGLDTDAPYWRRVLAYNIAGCIQSVLDEYVHVLREALGLIDDPPETASQQISTALCQALSLRTATLGVDRLTVAPESETPIQLESMRMRSHFALWFGEEKRDDGKGENRKEHVRQAFNSPFWPFVLATTSVGQEGLDFHTYCHAIVHWNLPSNPVDLEQREGRIHRYKGHAVRKNLATTYGLRSVTTLDRDPWDKLFEVAHRRRAGDALDLVPYWVFPGPARIERHVPVLPLSRDHDRLDMLRRSLAVYRMVFGQNRQEDLLAYLLTYLSPEQLGALMQDLCINLEPPHESHSVIHTPRRSAQTAAPPIGKALDIRSQDT